MLLYFTLLPTTDTNNTDTRGSRCVVNTKISHIQHFHSTVFLLKWPYFLHFIQISFAISLPKNFSDKYKSFTCAANATLSPDQQHQSNDFRQFKAVTSTTENYARDSLFLIYQLSPVERASATNLW